VVHSLHLSSNSYISTCVLFSGLNLFCLRLTLLVGRASVGVLWFAIFLQFALIAGVIYTLASDSIAMHRMQISVFGAIAIVFAVMGVDMGIFSGVASLDAMAAGWLILAIVDILWVLYFTSEEDSLALHVFNSLGTGGLTPPSRRRRQRTQSTMNNMGGIGGGNGVGYTNNYSSGGGIGSHDMPYTNAKMGSPVQSGGMGSGIGAPIRSQNSFNSGDAGRSMGNNSMTHIPHSNGPPSLTGGDNIGGGGLSSPLMASGGNAGSQASVGQSEHEYSKKAKALYACTYFHFQLDIHPLIPCSRRHCVTG